MKPITTSFPRKLRFRRSSLEEVKARRWHGPHRRGKVFPSSFAQSGAEVWFSFGGFIIKSYPLGFASGSRCRDSEHQLREMHLAVRGFATCPAERRGARQC